LDEQKHQQELISERLRVVDRFLYIVFPPKQINFLKQKYDFCPSRIRTTTTTTTTNNNNNNNNSNNTGVT